MSVSGAASGGTAVTSPVSPAAACTSVGSAFFSSLLPTVTMLVAFAVLLFMVVVAVVVTNVVAVAVVESVGVVGVVVSAVSITAVGSPVRSLEFAVADDASVVSVDDDGVLLYASFRVFDGFAAAARKASTFSRSLGFRQSSTLRVAREK